MRVRVLATVQTFDLGLLKPGMVVDLEEERAAAYLARGLAVPVCGTVAQVPTSSTNAEVAAQAPPENAARWTERLEGRPA